MSLIDASTSPRGRVRYEVRRSGLIVEVVDDRNLVVDASKALLASLLGGAVTNKSVTQIGFGASGTAASAGDTGITGGLVKAIDAVAYPAAGAVRFDFSLGSAEANGVAILEFGLFSASNVLFARRVRATPLNKASDVTLTGSWTITF